RCFEQPLSALAGCGQTRSSAPGAGVFEGDVEAVLRQRFFGLLGPFADGGCSLREQIVEAEREQLGRAGPAVEIEMLQWNGAAARTPAKAWRKTASRARSPVPPAPPRRARTAAEIPVSTSPAPAVAIPGLPAGQMALAPSGSAITECAPFSTMCAPNRCAAL